MEPGFGARQDDLGVPIAPQTTKLEIWVGPYGGPLKSTLHIAVSEASLSFDKKKKKSFLGLLSHARCSARPGIQNELTFTTLQGYNNLPTFSSNTWKVLCELVV